MRQNLGARSWCSSYLLKSPGLKINFNIAVAVLAVAREFFLWMMKLFSRGQWGRMVSHSAWAGARQSIMWVSLGGT